MKLSALYSILFIFLLSSCGEGRDENRSEDLLSKARQLDSLERYNEAIAVYDDVIRLEPNNVHALMDRAVDKGQINNIEGAIQDYMTIIRIDSVNTLAFYNLGILYGNRGSYLESINAFDGAMKTKGLEDGKLLVMTPVPNQFFDTGLESEGKTRVEFEVEEKVIRLERGIVFYKTDSVRKAYFDLTYCISHDYYAGEAYYYRARTYLKSAMLAHACKDAKNSLLHGMAEAKEIIDVACKDSVNIK